MSRAPLSRLLRTSRKAWSRLRRSSVVRSPYYRRHPIELGRLILGVRHLRSAAVSEPRDFLAHLGINVEETSDDFDRWRGILAPVLAGRSRVGINEGQGRILYAAVRSLRPSQIIETGVAEGVSSSFMGAALVDNGMGVLHSLELPPDHVPDDTAFEDGAVYSWQHKGVAFLVPHEIRTALGDRWDVRLGDVRDTLPTLLAELGSVDLFFHDDLHLPSHMLWEYELVWPRIPSTGLLLSDDANAGWITFARHHLDDGDGLVNYRRMTGARRP